MPVFRGSSQAIESNLILNDDQQVKSSMIEVQNFGGYTHVGYITTIRFEIHIQRL